MSEIVKNLPAPAPFQLPRGIAANDNAERRAAEIAAERWGKQAAAKAVVTVAEKSVVRGVFAWLGARLATLAANPAVGAAAAISDLCPGDTPIREHEPVRELLPPLVIDQPPFGKTVEQWLAEMDEAIRAAVEIGQKRSEIHRHHTNGDVHSALRTQQELDELLAYAQTIQNSTGAPITDGALTMIASAGGAGNASTAAPHQWQDLANKQPGLEVLQRIRDRTDEIKAEIVARIDEGQGVDIINTWFAQEVKVELNDLSNALHFANLDGNRNAQLIHHNVGQHIHTLGLVVEEALFTSSLDHLRTTCLTPSHNLELVAQWLRATFGSRAHIGTFGMLGASLSLNVRVQPFLEVLINLMDNAIRHGMRSTPYIIVVLLNDQLIVSNLHISTTAATTAKLLNEGHRMHEDQLLPADDPLSHGLGLQSVKTWAQQMGLSMSVVYLPIPASVIHGSSFKIAITGLGSSVHRTFNLQSIPWQHAARIPEPTLIPALVAHFTFSWRGRILQDLNSGKSVDDILHEIETELLPKYPEIREALRQHSQIDPEYREDNEAAAIELDHLVHTVPAVLHDSSRDVAREELAFITIDSGIRALYLIGTALFYPSNQRVRLKQDLFEWSSHSLLTQLRPAFNADLPAQMGDLDGTSILNFIQQVAPLITPPSNVEFARLHYLRHHDGRLVMWVSVISQTPGGVEEYLARIKQDQRLTVVGWQVVTEHQKNGFTDFGNLFLMPGTNENSTP